MYTQCHKDGCRFRVWAPERETVSLRIYGRPARAGSRGDGLEGHTVEMQKDAGGYFHADVPGAGDGTRYEYLIDKIYYPDPASASQAEGVFGPSTVVDHRLFVWHDAGWHVPPLAQLIFYELHV